MVEAAVLLVAARIAVAAVPFPLLKRVLGAPQHAPGAPDPVADVGPACRAVVRAAERLPFATACLPRAIAGQLMLRRRGLPASVVFGLARRDGEWLNHAWLEHAGQPVLGADDAVVYTRTISYRGAPLRWRSQTD